MEQSGKRGSEGYVGVRAPGPKPLPPYSRPEAPERSLQVQAHPAPQYEVSAHGIFVPFAQYGPNLVCELGSALGLCLLLLFLGHFPVILPVVSNSVSGWILSCLCLAPLGGPVLPKP